MLKMPESWDTCQGKLLVESGTSPRKGSILQSSKLEGVGDLKSASIADIEMQILDSAQLAFGLALV